MNSRRDLIKAAALAASLPVASAQQHEHKLTQIEKPKTPREPKFFSKAEFATLRVLVDLIIPRTETPGATDAGVDHLIDQSAQRSEPLAKEWRSGLAWLDSAAKRPFLALDKQAQVTLLTEAMNRPDSEGGRFFALLKHSTADAFYSTREGLSLDLGWNANTFLADFKGCTHAEHQG